MKTFLFIDLNILSSIFLFLIFYYTYKQIYNSSLTIKLLKNTIFLEILGSAIEVVYYLTDYLPVEFRYVFKYFTVILNLIIPMIMVYYFSRFIYAYIFREINTSKLKSFILSIPCLINITLVLSNIFTNYIFTLDNTTFEYTRNNGFILYSVLFGFYLMHNMAVILKNRKLLPKEDFFCFTLNNIIPIIGTAIQVLNNCRFLIIWSLNAVGLILILIYTHRKLARYDFLTNAWTRSAFDDLISTLKRKKYKKFSLAAIDIKDLHSINKKYGFAEGNIVLEKLTKIFKDSIKTKNIVTRYRQNEFMIIFFTNDLNAIRNDFIRIRKKFDEELNSKYKNLDYYFYCEAFNIQKYKTYSNFLRCIEKNLILQNDLLIKEVKDDIH